MTREKQRYLRELKKPFEQICRQIGKARSWKPIAGTRYQARDGMLYEWYLSLPETGCVSAMEAARDWCAARLAEEAAR